MMNEGLHGVLMLLEAEESPLGRRCRGAGRSRPLDSYRRKWTWARTRSCHINCGLLHYRRTICGLLHRLFYGLLLRCLLCGLFFCRCLLSGLLHCRLVDGLLLCYLLCGRLHSYCIIHGLLHCGCICNLFHCSSPCCCRCVAYSRADVGTPPPWASLPVPPLMRQATAQKRLRGPTSH
jgi:hypothetical protein